MSAPVVPTAPMVPLNLSGFLVAGFSNQNILTQKAAFFNKDCDIQVYLSRDGQDLIGNSGEADQAE